MLRLTNRSPNVVYVGIYMYVRMCVPWSKYRQRGPVVRLGVYGTAHGVIPEGVAMRGYDTSTAPYA